MKYVVFLGDGMADTPIEALGGKTPLAVAKKENIDSLAPKSEIGLAKTVPDGMKPGSDTANLAVMGYDPKICYSGRSPLEALSMGLTLSETDIAVRCNLVTLSSEEEHYADKRMIDYSAGEISTEEARELILYLEEHLGDERVSFHPGISYRHCLIVHDAKVGSELTPPHDITGKSIKRYLPSGLLGELFLDLQMKSYDLLKDHPINQKRVLEGKNPANSIWLWGEGTKPALPDFYQKNGIRGAVISAVDLLKGIGKGAGMEVIEVKGATGNVNTDFAAKGKAAIDALSRVDYVYIHVEAPDESGHQGSLEDKITSIEKIDSDIVGPVLAYLKASGEPYHVLVCPDHPTPLAIRTHSADPVPYLIYKSDLPCESGVDKYDEEHAASTGIYLAEGYHLIDRLLSSEPERAADAISPSLVTSADGSEQIRLESADEKEENPSDAPTEIEEEPSDEENAEEQNGKKKPGKFAAFFKRHLLFFILAISLLVIAGGLTAGHLIATHHLSFIRSEEGLDKALSKKYVTTLVFKKDVTLSSDLILSRPVNFDLNEHTLRVNGDFFLPLEEDVSIGYKTKGKYTRGGKIAAKNFTVTGTKTLTLYADLEADAVSLTAAKATIKGDIAGETTVTELNAAEIAYQGKVAGTLSLVENSALTLCGDAKLIEGGGSVTIKSGNVGTVRGSAEIATELFVYEGADVATIINVGSFYRVTQLAAPEKILVLQEDGDFVCYVSEVIGATHLSYTLNGVQKDPVAITHGTTVITLNSDDLTPGKQTIAIKATAPNDPRYLDSEEKTYSFEFSAKLDTPVLSASEEDQKVYLNISAVKHADSYLYKVDGAEYTTADTKTDITDKVSEGGVHILEVTAKSANKYFSDSNAAMTSYVTYITLAAPVPTATKESDDAVTFSWEAVEGATSYLVKYGSDVIYTTDLSLTLSVAESPFTISAVGGGYYLDSATATLTAGAILSAMQAVAD